jgi:hypothetical protein
MAAQWQNATRQPKLKRHRRRLRKTGGGMAGMLRRRIAIRALPQQKAAWQNGETA